jgi:hypothetical protein
LGIEVRLLPKATPELNAMDHLWKHTKREALGDRETVTYLYGVREFRALLFHGLC